MLGRFGVDLNAGIQSLHNIYRSSVGKVERVVTTIVHNICKEIGISFGRGRQIRPVPLNPVAVYRPVTFFVYADLRCRSVLSRNRNFLGFGIVGIHEIRFPVDSDRPIVNSFFRQYGNYRSLRILSVLSVIQLDDFAAGEGYDPALSGIHRGKSRNGIADIYCIDKSLKSGDILIHLSEGILQIGYSIVQVVYLLPKIVVVIRTTPHRNTEQGDCQKGK